MTEYHVVRTGDPTSPFLIHAEGCPMSVDGNLLDSRLFASSDTINEAFEQMMVGSGFKSRHQYRSTMWFSDFVESVLTVQPYTALHSCVMGRAYDLDEVTTLVHQGITRRIFYAAPVVDDGRCQVTITDQFEIGYAREVPMP